MFSLQYVLHETYLWNQVLLFAVITAMKTV